MSGVSKIEIHEDSATLLSLMKQQKQLSKHERVQALYLLKSGEANSIVHQVDRSAVHCTPKLEKPDNVAFLFQPAYSPELNPIEQLWSQLKAQLANRLWFDLNELQQALSHQLRQLTCTGLRSLTQRDFLMEAFEMAGIRPTQLVYP